MENKIKLTIGAIITLLLASSGTYYLSQDADAYYCESRDMVIICERLSSGLGTRCYYEDTYKICNEGWEKIEMGREINPKSYGSIEGEKWLCSPEECVSIE